MRQCKCGGLVKEHQLARSREAWTCGECGRYEVIERNNQCLKNSGERGLAMSEKAEKPNAGRSGTS
jgi:hypothetical protein